MNTGPVNTARDPHEASLGHLWPAGTSHPEWINFADPPVAMFRSVLDVPWFERAYDRWATSYRRDLTPWFSALLVGIGMCVILFVFIGDRLEDRWTRLLVCILAGALMSPLGYWGARHIKRQVKANAIMLFRNSREHEVPLDMALHREGLVSSIPIAVTVRRWSGFLAARRYSDGILIMLNPTHFHWLPWSDLVSGKPDDIDELLQANFADYKDVRA